MDNLNLPEFLSLFGCTSINDCWLSTDCIIDKSGIKATHSDDDSIARAKYYQSVKLSFPCTAQQLFNWAQRLDTWERFYAVGNQNHVVEKLPKEIVGKWQPVNELYRGWCYAQGGIKVKIGTEPFDVNWDYWLSLPKWTKKEAALLVSGLEPDKFHLVERLADYESMCEPLVKLQRRIPDDLTQSPYDWLNWFDEIGNLMYAPKALLVWFKQQSGIVALQAGADEDDDTGNQKQSELHHFIWRVRLSLIGWKKRHTWLDVWREIENNHTQHDLDTIIQEVMDGVIFWCSSGGTEQRLKKTSLCKTITGLKKKPPF